MHKLYHTAFGVDYNKISTLITTQTKDLGIVSYKIFKGVILTTENVAMK